MRSLGQAFDVCHKLNPKSQKKKNTSKESQDNDPSTAEKGEVATSEEKTSDEKEIQKEVKPPGEDVSSAWNQFGHDAVSADKPETTDAMSDLMQLNFDPFITPGSLPQLNQNLANGNSIGAMDPFQPSLMGVGMGGNPGGVAYPPLTVSNLSTSLPDFPDGVDPATASANILPPHMALLGRPRPRPSASGQQQVLVGLLVCLLS